MKTRRSSIKLDIHHSKVFSSDIGYSLYRIKDIFRIRNTGYRIQYTGYRIQYTGYRIQDTVYGLRDTGYRTRNLQNHNTLMDSGYWKQDTGYLIVILDTGYRVMT